LLTLPSGIITNPLIITPDRGTKIIKKDQSGSIKAKETQATSTQAQVRAQAQLFRHQSLHHLRVIVKADLDQELREGEPHITDFRKAKRSLINTESQDY